MDSTDDLKPPIATTAEENLRNASEISAVNLLLAQNELAIRMAGAATLSTKTLLDISEHAYKVSGMAKKQEVKAAGPGFSIMINLPGGQTALIGRDRKSVV